MVPSTMNIFKKKLPPSVIQFVSEVVKAFIMPRYIINTKQQKACSAIQERPLLINPYLSIPNCHV